MKAFNLRLTLCLAGVLVSATGCSTTTPPSVPLNAKITPINRVQPAASMPKKPVDVTQSVPVPISSSEIPIFRALDPDALETMLRAH